MKGTGQGWDGLVCKIIMALLPFLPFFGSTFPGQRCGGAFHTYAIQDSWDNPRLMVRPAVGGNRCKSSKKTLVLLQNLQEYKYCTIIKLQKSTQWVNTLSSRKSCESDGKHLKMLRTFSLSSVRTQTKLFRTHFNL